MTSIDELTVGDLKRLKVFLGTDMPAETASPMIGKYVVVRCRDAGIHAGTLVSQTGREVVLSESRRLWYWQNQGKNLYLSGIALHGIDYDESRVGAELPLIQLTETCEIILASDEAAASIKGVPTHERS